MKICEGWRESCAKLAATGYYRENPKETKVFGKIALATLLEIQDGDAEGDERKRLFDRLGSVFEKLSKKWKKFQNK